MPNLEFLTEKRYTLSSHMIEVAMKEQLSLIEFLLLIYFEDTLDKTLDVEKISKALYADSKEVLLAFNKLLTSNLIEMSFAKDSNNKKCEVISLNPLYRSIFEKKEEETKEKNKESIFDLFQKELGRGLTPMEYQIINDWLEQGLEEELILSALKEAVYNGVSSLRYIQKILFEWKKKGYHTAKDVENGLKNFRKEKEEKKDLFDYNWLDEDE